MAQWPRPRAPTARSSTRAERHAYGFVIHDRPRVVERAAFGVGKLPRRMDHSAVDVRKLGYIAADVFAGRIEPHRLSNRVEHAVGTRVVASSGDPLPVARVVGDVAVDEPVDEVRRTDAPVDAEVFG